MSSLLYPVSAVIALLALLYKVRILRTERSTVQLALVAHFFFLVVVFTVSTPTVWAWTSRAVGVPNFSGLLTQSGVIVMSACQQLVLLHLTHEPETARRKTAPRLIALGLVLIAMALLFREASFRDEAPRDFALTQATDTPIYLALYLLAYTANQAELGMSSWRYSKIAPSPWLRRGLRLVALSLPLTFLYVGCRSADIIAAQLGFTGRPWEPAAQVGAAVAAAAQTLGWTLPDWGHYMTSLAGHIYHRRAHRALTPLHRQVTAQVPEPVIPLIPHMDLRGRLYRMVIEIRDAQWALRSWMDPAVAHIAREQAEQAGLLGDELAAAVEATQFRAAIEAKTRGIPPGLHVETPLAAEPRDLAAEIVYQRRLARAMSSPFVARVLAHHAVGANRKEDV
ncbi:MAB_1171c family putative transporter [Streptomyces sp. NPDC002889]|uniref:MAB_1171c family putative transporter n=1 Tax=Streptomyces sp. NPDC002889 TaxID=3364669 RepID=UPI0036AF2C63